LKTKHLYYILEPVYFSSLNGGDPVSTGELM